MVVPLIILVIVLHNIYLTEYLTIPITYIIKVYRELKFDTPIDNTNTNTNLLTYTVYLNIKNL